MKVKIGNKIYDSNKEPIMVLLTEYNKIDISNMGEDDFEYCEFPDEMTKEEVMEFMK